MRHLMLVGLLALGVASGAEAQRGTGRGADTLRRPPADMDRRIQERMGQMLKQTLRLTDAQARQMQEVNARFAPRRMALFRDERGVREAMRREMTDRDAEGSPELARLIDRAIDLQRTRIALLDEEQQALATFLTPMQRARYMAFEEELQRRADEMRRQNDGRGPGGGGRGGPPARDTVRRGGGD
jgi:hypothetical protein